MRVIFLGYAGTSQMDCLRLMAKKITVSQSTSGGMPECGLDVLNDNEGESIDVALARELLAAWQGTAHPKKPRQDLPAGAFFSLLQENAGVVHMAFFFVHAVETSTWWFV